MPSTLRLLQRMQRTIALLLRPAESPLDKPDINISDSPSVPPIVFLPGQLPPSQECARDESLRRWRERQQLSRAGPWQMK